MTSSLLTLARGEGESSASRSGCVSIVKSSNCYWIGSWVDITAYGLQNFFCSYRESNPGRTSQLAIA
jgi:hypothetical protein